MKIFRNISLRSYNTFGLDYKTDTLIVLKTEKEARLLFSGEITLKHPVLITGSGSNILFIRDFEGTVINSDIKGIRVISDENDKVIISAGSGIVWDELIEWCVDNGYGGLENLSLIPGKTGAAAVQNIGAYGVEAKDVILKVKAISTNDGSVHFFSNKDCEFAYRESIFKKGEKGKYFITRIWFRLSKKPEFRLNYGSLADETGKLGDITLENIRKTIIRIRSEKLPDPSVTGNAGSFFKNPVISAGLAEPLLKEYPRMAHYPDKQGSVKVAAGWLIETCGWKGKRTGDAGVHDRQALVLVNHGNASGKELLKLSEDIRESVFKRFGILLEREVEVI
jgi:UDP-N-acetylmuramate dehydrogenase